MRYHQDRGQYRPAPDVPGPVPGDYAPYDSTLYKHSAVATAYCGGASVPPKGEKQVWGVRASVFWVGVVALVFFLGTIGASAAAGTIAQAHATYVQTCQAKLVSSSASSSAASASARPSSPTAPGAGTGEASGTSTLASASANPEPTDFVSIPLPQQASSIPGHATTSCPDLPPGNRTYAVPGSGMRFARECGNDYPLNDLGRIPLTRMEDCMNLCAALAVGTQSADGPCVGVAWVTAGKQGTDQNYCWLKSGRGAPDPRANVEVAWIETW